MPLRQTGKAAIHILDAGLNGGGGLGIGAHLQILLHRHFQKHMPPLGDLCQAALDDLVGRNAMEVVTVEDHAAALRMEQAGDRVEHGGFSRAVGADEGDDLPLPDRKGDALDRVDAAVIDLQVLHLKQCLAHACTSLLLPR